MSQSFLNIPGLPLGLRNNNPGNLRPLPGNTTWQGEIDPDRVNNFSRFQNIGYGLRAMITDITGDIVNDKQNTLRKLITAYAPPSENNTAAYINAVANYTGLAPDTRINADRPTIEKIIRAKMNVELTPAHAARVSQADINEAFSLLSPQVKQWLGLSGAASGVSAVALFSIFAALTYLVKKSTRKQPRRRK